MNEKVIILKNDKTNRAKSIEVNGIELENVTNIEMCFVAGEKTVVEITQILYTDDITIKKENESSNFKSAIERE